MALPGGICLESFRRSWWCDFCRHHTCLYARMPTFSRKANSEDVATWESRAGTRDETRDATGVEQNSRNSWRTASHVDVGDWFEQKFCFRVDPAKDKMIFSEESTRAISEMGNVELIELKKARFNVHHVFEGTTTCTCGKLSRPNKKCDGSDQRSIRCIERDLIIVLHPSLRREVIAVPTLK